MAVNDNLGAAVCMLDVQPDRSVSRDLKDPLELMMGLLNIGCSVGNAEDMVRDYYRSQLLDKGGGGDHGVHVDEPSQESDGPSQISSRSMRSQKFFEACDRWLDEEGFCYTTLLRPSRRGSYARKYGKDVRLDTIFKFSPDDITWTRLKDVRVSRIDHWHVHLSYADKLGSQPMLSHMAAFAADFPTMVPRAWLEALRNVEPVEDGWFGMTTTFGYLGNPRSFGSGFQFQVSGNESLFSSIVPDPMYFDCAERCEDRDFLVSRGYCYTVVISAVAQDRIAAVNGPVAGIKSILELHESDLAADLDVHVVRVARDLFHLSKIPSLGSRPLLPLLVDFFQDYGGMQDSGWLRVLSGVKPLGDHWFNTESKFGATLVADQPIRKHRVVYGGTDSRASSVDYSVVYVVSDDEYVEVDVPVGIVLDDGFSIVADARLAPVTLLLLATSGFYVFGKDSSRLTSRVIRNAGLYHDLIQVYDMLVVSACGKKPSIITRRDGKFFVVAMGFNEDRLDWVHVATAVGRRYAEISVEVVSVLADACALRIYTIPRESTPDFRWYRKDCLRYYQSLVAGGTDAGVFCANVPVLAEQLTIGGKCLCGYDFRDDKFLMNRHLNELLSVISDDAKWYAVYSSDSNLPRVQYAVQ